MSQLNLSAQRLDIRVTRGTTLRLRWTLTEEDGTPIDLTGATVVMTVRTTQAKASALIFSQLGVTESPASAGKTVITRTDEEMATIGVDGRLVTYFYELRLIEADGDEYVPFAGLFQVDTTPAAP